MPRKKKDDAATITPTGETKPNSLLAGVKFVSAAQTDIGEPYKRHCVLWDGWIYGFNGILSAGCKVDDHAQIAAHTDKLLAALERADTSEPLKLTQVARGLEVRSGRLKAIIPCLPLADMVPIAPDAPAGPADDRLRKALSATAPLVSDGARFILEAGVKLSGVIAVSTDRRVLIEAYHGIELPNVVLPKIAIKELLKINKPIVGYGVTKHEGSETASSMTFYFNDESWLKTQLYPDEFPSNYRSVFEGGQTQIKVPEGMAAGLKTIAPFCEENRAVYFLDHQLSTTADGEGTTVDIDDVPGGHCFNVDALVALVPTMQTFGMPVPPAPGDTTANRREVLVFFGDDLRGAIAPINPHDSNG